MPRAFDVSNEKHNEIYCRVSFRDPNMGIYDNYCLNRLINGTFKGIPGKVTVLADESGINHL